MPDEKFDAFFIAMRDAFREILGAEWTSEIDASWRNMLADFAAIR